MWYGQWYHQTVEITMWLSKYILWYLPESSEVKLGWLVLGGTCDEGASCCICIYRDIYTEILPSAKLNIYVCNYGTTYVCLYFKGTKHVAMYAICDGKDAILHQYIWIRVTLHHTIWLYCLIISTPLTLDCWLCLY